MRISGWSSDVCSSDLHAIGGGFLRVVGIQTSRDSRLGIVGIVGNQLVDHGAGKRHQLRAARSGWVLDVCRRVAYAIHESIDLAVAQGRAMLVGAQFRCQGKVAQVQALRSEEHTSELQSLMRTTYA